MSAITGFEFKKFYNDQRFWGGDTYHDDVLIKAANGDAWSDSDDIYNIPDGALLTIESGWVNEINPEVTGQATDMSLPEFFALWRSKQGTPMRVLVVECSADDEERVRAAIAAAGGKISG